MTDSRRDETRSQETDFAALWSSDGITRSMSPTSAGMPADLPFLFSGGQQFGGYRIVRPIGKGGMGQVYEAEELDSGRRVALKLLSRGLGDDEERERFLREGQLAASLSHPNCVYVFGTSEIQGFPVIAMELVPEGTLKDLVVPEAPMTAAQAVDAILQVIPGLEAAAAIGVLHRDVKPSNCFVHRGGRVLVGDFGLSVAASRDDRNTGTILGTPGFASPEQLRGDSLDVRSDIYSVGATLFYLLAGRAPFDDRDTTTLLKRVASDPPPLLTSLRSDLPRGVAAIVAKCLAKSPAERYASYASLRSALEPFGSARVTTGPIVRRTAAGILDAWLVGLPVIPLNLLLQLRPVFEHRADGYIIAAVTVAFALLYYGLCEGLWGASAGKAIVGLRVVDEHQVSPGFKRAAFRALVFEGSTQLMKQLANTAMLLAGATLPTGPVTGTMAVVWLAVLFFPARKKNGYTAFHDRFTNTRVVRRRQRAEARERSVRTVVEAAAPFDSTKRVGPFLVPEVVHTTVSQAHRVEGYDDRLKRRVWIELLPAGTAPLSAERRDLGRPTRLRWLAGRRDGAESWDAYEAVDGEPFDAVNPGSQPWSRVRHWLTDLAREIAAGSSDGSLPPLTPARVWMDADGHARILEWSPPARPQPPDDHEAPTDLAGAQKFLYGLATAALLGVPFVKARNTSPETPLPLKARAFLLSLRDAKFTSATALLEGLEDMGETPAVIARSRRAAQIAACAAGPIIISVIAAAAIVLVSNTKLADRTLFGLEALLDQLEDAEKSLAKKPDPAVQQRRDDIEVYLAEHMASMIERPDTWENQNIKIGARGGRERARRAVERHRVRTREEVRRAEATALPILTNQAEGLSKLANARALAGIVVATLGGTCIAIAFLAALGALATGSGFSFRAFGAALVNRKGKRISRVRALWRAAVAWSPMIVLFFVFKNGPDITKGGYAFLFLDLALVALLTAGAVWAILRPSRGIQDRLAGTWIVPR
jgi:eukaryotic-like serine/threonine-protein kinase